MTLRSTHLCTVLEVPQALLLGKELLTLFHDLTLHTKLDLTKLLFLTTKLILLESHTLVHQVLAGKRRVRSVVVRHATGKLLRTVVFVQEVVRDFLKVVEM